MTYGQTLAQELLPLGSWKLQFWQILEPIKTFFNISLIVT